MRILNNSLIGASVALIVAASATAQVSYNETFDVDAAGWTITGGYNGAWSSANACGGAGGTIRSNIYGSSPMTEFVSPLVGTAVGGSITISYDYQCLNYSGSGPAPAPWGTIEVFYGPTAVGPWTSIAATTDEAQTGSCITKSHSFSTSGDVYVRFEGTRTGGDFYMHVDNVDLSEAGGSPCAGTPTPGDTTVAGSICTFGDAVTLGLQNSTSGVGVSYQWYESADGISYSAFGTDAATQVVMPGAATYYYCDVTCSAGPSTGSSNVVLVDLDAPAFPQGFDTGINDNCWTDAGTAALKSRAVSAFGIGAACVEYDFYSISAGNTLEHTSPVFTPVGAGTNIYFDVAGKQYNSAVDTIELQESNDGGANWTAVVTMTNDGLTGELNTAGTAGFPEFEPTADQWASLAFPLTAGTNCVRFVATSGFGNNVYIDNVSVGVLPSARHTAYGAGCADPFALSSATPPVDDAVVTFDVTGAPEAQAASGVYFGVVIISFSQVFPGFDLAVIGAEPGCNAFVGGLDVLEGYVSVGSDSASVVLDLPPGIPPGTLLYEQAAAVVEATATNPAGLLTSNGLRSYINTF